jgi:hypothetical protein
VSKVIAMIKALKETAIDEGKDEKILFAEHAHWCKTSLATYSKSITSAKEKITELEDMLTAATKKEGSIGNAAEKLDEQIQAKQAAGAAADKLRAEDAATFAEADKANDDIIAGLTTARESMQSSQKRALEEAMAGAADAPSLKLAQHHVRKVISLISEAAEEQVESLSHFAATSDYLPAAAEKDRIIELLKSLKEKYQDEKAYTIARESNALKAYSLAKHAREVATSAAQKAGNEKKLEVADTQTALVEGKASLSNTEADLEAHSKAEAATQKECTDKQNEWDERSKTRSLEIEAMDMAVKILAKATGVRSEAPSNPMPPVSPVLLQLSRPASIHNARKAKAVALIRSAGKKAHSKALERLAVEVSAHLDGPFDQMNRMIQKMISRLAKEQTDEDEHKLWCDKEISKTELMKEDKADKKAALVAEIAVQNIAVSELRDAETVASQTISDIDAFVQDATAIRSSGKSENEQALKDAQAAQAAISDASAVLRSFYKSSGAETAEEPSEPVEVSGAETAEEPSEPSEFMQMNKAGPATWEAKYTGVADPQHPEGITAVLADVSTHFAKMEAETRAQERMDQIEFEETMADNKIEKARCKKENEMATAEIAKRVENVAILTSKEKDLSAELGNVEQYLIDLKPACTDGDTSYAERKAARTEESEALRTAQQTLADAFKATSFLQKH